MDDIVHSLGSDYGMVALLVVGDVSDVESEVCHVTL